jgi:hypothetical protein
MLDAPTVSAYRGAILDAITATVGEDDPDYLAAIGRVVARTATSPATTIVESAARRWPSAGP